MLQPKHVFIGSYTNNLCTPSVYDLRPKQLAAYKIDISLTNPSYLHCHQNLIYIVQNKNYGILTVINEDYQLVTALPTEGNDPVHLSIHPQSTYLAVTNYSSGSFVVYKLEKNIPTEIIHFVMHEGSSTNNQRQLSSHPHSSLFSEDGKILFVADLGTDFVYYYDFCGQKLEHMKDKSIKMVGSGPRHLKHGGKDEKLLFLSCELDSTIRMLSYKKDKLQLVRAYRISESSLNYPSQIVYRSPFVYMCSRGQNCLIIFEEIKEEETPRLQQKFRFKVGQWPRHFKVSSAGTIYVACQNQNIVQRFKWEDGKIFQLGSLKISSPSCIGFEE